MGQVGRWLCALAWCGVLLGLSSQPGRDLPRVGFSHLDKLVHLVLYSILGMLLMWAVSGGRAGRLGHWLLVVAMAAAFGALDEWYQHFIPGRDTDLVDLLADVLGASLGAAVVWRRSRHFSQRG